MNTNQYLAAVLTTVLLANPVSADEEKWTDLLDPKLSQWELWMGVPRTSVKDLPEGTQQLDDYNKGTPLGLANDPKKVFSVIQEDGKPVLKITGEIYGGLTTLKEFSDNHFSCEVKFGDKKWEPRLKKQRDSGVLYHCTGEHGAFWNVWMRSLEYQVQEERASYRSSPRRTLMAHADYEEFDPGLFRVEGPGDGFFEIFDFPVVEVDFNQCLR